ncbi:MAG: DUF4296 domain-containing protein [Bacteroidales bacterium]|nr:DUF4296 domain-containing protein [Bacteroidales bacterium]
MRHLLHMALLLVLAVSCHRGPERIPRRQMEDIMYQVLLQDQYLKQHPELRRQADTSLVYEGIFESQGFDTDDFLYSLDYYLQDPSRMEKIMEKVGDRLEAEGKVIDKELKAENWRKEFLRLYSLSPDTRHLPQPVSPLDSLAKVQFHKDSLFYIPHR